MTALPAPAESAFAWLAGEATMVRSLRRALVAKGIPKSAIDFTGYWRHHLTQDDPLTEADEAELRERLTDMEVPK